MSKLTLTFKGKVLKVYPVLKGSMILGSDTNCPIYIDSLAVQSEHAEINTVQNDSVIRDLNTEEGTYIGQDKIEGVHSLKDGDVIRVGKHTLAFSYSAGFIKEPDPVVEAAVEDTTSPAQVEEQVKKQGWLQIMNGPSLGKTMSLNKSMTNLGKPGLSSAVISKRQNGYFISQLDGTDKHPVLITNKELDKKGHQLNDGEIIQIGNIKMQFYYE